MNGDVPRCVLTGTEVRVVVGREHPERAEAMQEYRELGNAAEVGGRDGVSIVLSDLGDLGSATTEHPPAGASR